MYCLSYSLQADRKVGQHADTKADTKVRYQAESRVGKQADSKADTKFGQQAD